MHVYEPLVNGRLVTIELIAVNEQFFPVRSLEKAVRKWDQYIAGAVEITQGQPVKLDLGEDRALSNKQFEEIVLRCKYSGQSAINLIVAPDFEYFKTRGRYKYESPGRNVRQTISINAKICNESASKIPLVSEEDFWSVVILHELCHALNVPARKMHAHVDGQHCAKPECVLYSRVDARSVTAGILTLGPPRGLCRLCREEILEAQKAAGGEFYDNSKYYDRFKDLIALNPGSIDAYAQAGLQYMSEKDYDKAVESLSALLEKSPEYKYPSIADGMSAMTLRAMCHYNEKNHEKALADLKQAIQITPDDPTAPNFYALILSTSSQAELRNGKVAIEAASKACELTGWNDPSHLDVLACAYAETGDFDSAVKYERQAISLSKDGSIGELNRRFEMFQNRQAFRAP
jgi:tetratricopeptide (TPR) repeat protein